MTTFSRNTTTTAQHHSCQHLLPHLHHHHHHSSSHKHYFPPFHPCSFTPLHRFFSAIKALYQNPPSFISLASPKNLFPRRNHPCASFRKSLYLTTESDPAVVDLDSYNEHADLYQCELTECGVVLTPCVIHDQCRNSSSSAENTETGQLHHQHSQTTILVQNDNSKELLRKEISLWHIVENWPAITGADSSNGYRRFTIHELVAATSKFSEKNILGKGSHGTIYLGKLPSGRKIAVKCLSFGMSEAEKDFRMQLDIMSTVKHRYILPLLGYATDEGHLFLVYKFLSCGNVDTLLHTGQLSDFGLAMWAPPSFLICSDVMGTFGYVAPEYFQYGKVSKKVDVFAFGVVLLELITGRRAIEPLMPVGEENLVLWARPLMWSGLTEMMIDPRLKGCYCARRMQKMLSTAALCVHPSDIQRPSMNQALHLLERSEEEGSFCLFPKQSPSSVFLTMDKEAVVIEEEEEERVASKRQRERHLAVAMMGKSCEGDADDEKEEMALLLNGGGDMDSE